jgi:hypothetical protein
MVDHADIVQATPLITAIIAITNPAIATAVGLATTKAMANPTTPRLERTHNIPATKFQIAALNGASIILTCGDQGKGA